VKRRKAIAILGGAATMPALAVHAQQPGPRSARFRVIGYLNYFAPGPNPIGDAIVAELRRLGWAEGETVKYDRRYGLGDLTCPRRSSPAPTR